jgi:hypothetical protein
MNEHGPLAHDRFCIVTALAHYLELFGQEDVDIRSDFTGRKVAGTSRIRSTLAKRLMRSIFRGRQGPDRSGNISSSCRASTGDLGADRLTHNVRSASRRVERGLWRQDKRPACLM